MSPELQANFQAALEIFVVGWGGIFVVMAALLLAIKILLNVFKEQ
ncbi:hypothetical protein SAMN04487985_10571 [Aerococcus urinaehominis]|nr:OadG-related small transporter subunit [Aerococcus urinaehominis]SDM10723.1 hypothetical protein SAMN04487985_10571 [Aerococcus urinaehominis]